MIPYDSQAEEWRPVVGWERTHSVSSFGRVRKDEKLRVGGFGYKATEPSRQLPQRPNGNGYPTVTLRATGRPNLVKSVHLLVIEAFTGPRPGPSNQIHCRHLDGNKYNNYSCNLAWGTVRENMRDKEIHGVTACGEKNGTSKLKKYQVADIVASLSNGAKSSDVRAMANKYGVTYQAIHAILTGKTWKHLALVKSKPDRSESGRRTRKLSAVDVAEIRAALTAGGPRGFKSRLAERYGISRGLVYNIESGARLTS